MRDTYGGTDAVRAADAGVGAVAIAHIRVYRAVVVRAAREFPEEQEAP